MTFNILYKMSIAIYRNAASVAVVSASVEVTVLRKSRSDCSSTENTSDIGSAMVRTTAAVAVGQRKP